MEFDEILKDLNGFGRYQWFVLFITCLPWMTIAFNHLVPVFVTARTPYVCANNVTRGWTSDIANASDGDQCFTRSDGNLSDISGQQACTAWYYGETPAGSTIVSQWDLVCDRQWMVSVSTSVYMAGLLVGLLPIAILADKIGRRKALHICTTGVTAFMFAAAFSPNIYVFMAFRFMTGIFTQGLGSTLYVYAIESVSMQYRLLAAFLNLSGYGTGTLILVAVAYVSRDRQNTMLVTAGISGAITLICFMTVRESARWLYASGDSDRGEAEIRRIAKVNRREHVLGDKIDVTVNTTKKGNTIDLLKTPVMRKRTLISWYIWFVASLVYFGLYLGTSGLGIDVYLNMLIGGLSAFLGSLIKLFLLTKFGRRIPGISVYCIAGASLLLTLAFDSDSWMVPALSLTGRMFIGIAFEVAYIFSAELTPTVLRSNGLSTGSICARIGGVLAPFIGELNAFHPALSSIIFGLTSLVAGVLIYFLPETKGVKLPDQVADIEIKQKEPVLEVYSVGSNKI